MIFNYITLIVGLLVAQQLESHTPNSSPTSQALRVVRKSQRPQLVHENQTQIKQTPSTTTTTTAASDTRRQDDDEHEEIFDQPAANNGDKQNQLEKDHEQVKPSPKLSSPIELQKCDPMVSLPSFVAKLRARNNNITISSPTDTSIELNHTVSLEAKRQKRTFVLPFDDIKMTLMEPSGTMHSAMRFITDLMSPYAEASDSLGPSISSSDGEPDQEQEEDKTKIKFTENKLYISGINITMMNSHLYESNMEPRFELNYNIRNCTVIGRFKYHGPLIISSKPLSGFYKMSTNNAYMIASTNLTKVQHDQKAFLRTNDFKLNITNMDYIDITLASSKEGFGHNQDYLIHLLQRLLQKTVKRIYNEFRGYITETLQNESRKSIDCELSQYAPILDATKPVIGSQDIADILSLELNRSNLTRLQLPDYDYKQALIGTHGTIKFYNGTLMGTDNIYFSGDTRIKLDDKHLYMSSKTGWTDIETRYDFNLTLGNNNLTATKGFFSFIIKRMEFDTIITRGFEGSAIRVEQLNIEKFEKPRMVSSGMPGMNRISRGIVNFFMARLESRLKDILQPTLRTNLEVQLNKFCDKF